MPDEIESLREELAQWKKIWSRTRDEELRLQVELAQWKKIWSLTRDEELRLQVELAHARQELLMALGRTCRCVNTGATNE